MNRPKSRGLVYSRRSTDKQEMSLPKQLECAIAAAQQHSVAFDATIADLAHMQSQHLHSHKDIRLDDSITGSDLTRPGFCDRYMRTAGAECASNQVDGEAILRFTLKTLKQFVDLHGRRDKLRQKLLVVRCS